MKPLVKKLLETGIVDKHSAQMMEKWGSLEPGASDLVGQKKLHSDGLVEFAEEIETLLDSERGQIKETRLDISLKAPPAVYSRRSGQFAAGCDELNRLICAPNLDFLPGEKIQDERDGRLLEILEIEPIYDGDKVYALQLTIDW